MTTTHNEPLTQLIRDSHRRKAVHPHLKLLVLRATDAALRQEIPDKYFEASYAAAVAMYGLLRSLAIRSTICGGGVQCLSSGVDNEGKPTCGVGDLGTVLPGRPILDHWLRTEFGEIVDLTCSFFRITIEPRLTGIRSLDVFPAVWLMESELAALRSVHYSAWIRTTYLNLNCCIDPVKRLVATATSMFQSLARVRDPNGEGFDPGNDFLVG